MAVKGNGALKHGEADQSEMKCGIVMPISSIGDYPDSHWIDVLSILKEAITDAGLEANLVSYADEAALIPKTIVQNLYENPIVICDVSAKNPNVMFELGLRLAFDKPTIIVKDDETTFSFDTGAIEHIQYPRDLRFTKIVGFKATLTAKIRATLEAAKNPEYSTFLKHFGRFTVAKLEERQVSGQEFVAEELRSIHQTLAQLSAEVMLSHRPRRPYSVMEIDVTGLEPEARETARRMIKQLRGVEAAKIQAMGGAAQVSIAIDPDIGTSRVRNKIFEIVDRIGLSHGPAPIVIAEEH